MLLYIIIFTIIRDRRQNTIEEYNINSKGTDILVRVVNYYILFQINNI